MSRIQIQKEAEVLSNNPDSEFFGEYNKALNAVSTEKNIRCAVYARRRT